MDNKNPLENEIEENTPAKKFTRRTLRSEIHDWVESLATAMLVVLVIMTFVVRVNDVVGESMENTLHNGNKLLVWQLGYTPQIGDVVILQAENITNKLTGERGEAIVKRVVGVGGDVIDISDDGHLIRNGEIIEEDYVKALISDNRRGNAEYPVTVPENEIFVMGDNRNNSLDSRFVKHGTTDRTEYLGCVNVDLVVGKAFCRFFPFDDIGFIN